MAVTAKILGVLCMLTAAVVAANVVYTVGTADWSPATSEVEEFGTGLLLLILAGQVAFGLLLATVGAAAWVVGDVAERRLPVCRAAPVERPYGASLRN